jgi:hypothetical protein
MKPTADLAARVAGSSKTVTLDYNAFEKAWLLKPLELPDVAVSRGRTLLGPLSYSVLRALVGVGLPSRFQQAQDVWRRLYRSGYPTDGQRDPGGEPVANVQSGVAYWELLGLTATVLEDLAALVHAVESWRDKGAPAGLDCDVGMLYLDARVYPSKVFSRAATSNFVARLFAYPDQPRIEAAGLAESEARALAQGVAASAEYLAEFFAFAQTIYTRRLHRTFIRWKHRAAVVTPDAAPVWLQFSPKTRARLEPLFRRGIAVWDTGTTRVAGAVKTVGQLTVWPMTRETVGVHLQILITALAVTEGLAASVVVAAENGRHLSLVAARPASPLSSLEQGLASYGGHQYALLDADDIAAEDAPPST